MSYCRHCGHKMVEAWTGKYDMITGEKEMAEACAYRYCSYSESWNWMIPVGALGIIIIAVSLIIMLTR